MPPGVASASIPVDPTHTELMPVMGNGAAFTVTVTEIKQPVAIVYLIKDVPGDMPVTSPVRDPIVAMPVDAELQLPPGAGSVR